MIKISHAQLAVLSDVTKGYTKNDFELTSVGTSLTLTVYNTTYTVDVHGHGHCHSLPSGEILEDIVYNRDTWEVERTFVTPPRRRDTDES